MSSSSHSVPTDEREEIDGEYAKNCNCGLKSKTCTSWTQRNPCRRFKGCRLFYDSKNHCNFFSWLDPELSCDWYKKNMYQMHFELEKHKREERREDVEKELKNADLEHENRMLKLKISRVNESKRILEIELQEAKKKKSLYYRSMVWLMILIFALIMKLVFLV